MAETYFVFKKKIETIEWLRDISTYISYKHLEYIIENIKLGKFVVTKEYEGLSRLIEYIDEPDISRWCYKNRTNIIIKNNLYCIFNRVIKTIKYPILDYCNILCVEESIFPNKFLESAIGFVSEYIPYRRNIYGKIEKGHQIFRFINPHNTTLRIEDERIIEMSLRDILEEGYIPIPNNSIPRVVESVFKEFSDKMKLLEIIKNAEAV